MKSILSILFSLFAVVAFAVAPVQTMTNSGDTITNNGTGSVYQRINAYHATLAFQAKVTKVSGTVDAYVILQASNDNTNWYPVGTDTLKCANQATNTKVWVVSGNAAAYYRLYYYNGGTMVATITGYVYGQPQSAFKNQVYTMTGNGDTIVNTATDYVEYQVKAYHKTMSIQALVSKVSGTVAGTVTIQGSLDGTNFVTVSTTYLDGTATLTALNQSATTKLFVITGSPYRYYRLSYTGSGTMSARLYGYLVAND